MGEQKVINAVTRLLKKRGAWHFNNHGSGMGRNGLPDIIAIYHGTPLAIECKSTTGKLRPLQHHELDRAKRAGAIVVIARTAFDVKRALDQIDEHERSIAHSEPRTACMCQEGDG